MKNCAILLRFLLLNLHCIFNLKRNHETILMYCLRIYKGIFYKENHLSQLIVFVFLLILLILHGIIFYLNVYKIIFIQIHFILLDIENHFSQFIVFACLLIFGITFYLIVSNIIFIQIHCIILFIENHFFQQIVFAFLLILLFLYGIIFYLIVSKIILILIHFIILY